MSRAMRMLGLAAAAVGTAYFASTLRSTPPGPLPGPHPDRGETARPPQSRGNSGRIRGRASTPWHAWSPPGG